MNGYHKFVVAKPVCLPFRSEVLTMLGRYGITDARVGRERYEYGENSDIPKYALGELYVRKSQAIWAEYLIFRRGWAIRSGVQDEKNRQAVRLGYMPQPWKSDEAWIEEGCSNGLHSETMKRLVKVEKTGYTPRKRSKGTDTPSRAKSPKRGAYRGKYRGKR